MKLAGIDCQVPSNQIYNEDIVDLVKFHSAALCANRLTELTTLVKKFLALTGIKSRFWRNKDEKPINLIRKSVDNALTMAGIGKHDIDLVIYSSIDRGFLEPANASFICKAIGLDNVRNFDVVDACMGWASAVQIADSFLLSSPSINHVLIINAEFPMDRKGSVLPDNFTINDKKELRWKSASFTLGEAASASIFKKDAALHSRFEFIENAKNAELCNIPLANFEKYTDSEENCFHSNFAFLAHSSALFKTGINPSIRVLQTLMSNLNYKPKIIFPHSVSNKIINEVSLSVGVHSSVYSTFSTLGNLATVSVPSSINSALVDQRINKDDSGVVWIASAGMKYAAFEIHL